MPKRKANDPDRSPDMPHNWIERQIQRVEALVYSDPVDLDSWEYRRARLKGPGDYEYLDDDWKPIRQGEEWGGPEVTAFFRRMLEIPASHKNVDAVLDIHLDGGECQLLIDGRPFQGLDCYRSIVPLGELAASEAPLRLDMEAFVINYPYDARRGDERDFHRFDRARLLKRDGELEEFTRDARFALDAYRGYLKDDGDLEIEGYLRHHLEEACRLIPPSLTDRDALKGAALRAKEYLRKTIYSGDAYGKNGKINICGHSHLDIVYLWPIKETYRKNSRTATNMLSLMREFPEFKFSSSQPFLFEKMKEMYPAVFEEVKQRVKEGRWEVTGAMYVEPDGNVLGPESMVRQILFGKRFYRQEFGIDTKTCWLPDVFGVMYTLPQILRKSGIKYFSSIKLNIWNDTNDFPYNSFKWRGPDGSEVLAHFPPTHFAVDCKPELIRKNWDGFKEKNTMGESLFLYGWADGGGGPTREMAAAETRSRNFPGLPQTETAVVDEYLKKLESDADRLPVWDDELYLEAHRGTYTTKADLKRLNRKGELLYRDAEILNTLATLFGAEAKQEELNAGWKLLLVNQFHDTLPGTHVPEAVPDIKGDYEEIYRIGEGLRDEALRILTNSIAGASGPVVFNTLSWERKDLIRLPLRPEGEALELNGQSFPLQNWHGASWAVITGLPSLGWQAGSYAPAAGESGSAVQSFDKNRIETPFYIIEIDDSGNLSRIYDKEHDREVLSAPGNRFQVFEDDPGHTFSSWDVAYHFEEFEYPVEQTVRWTLECNGPVFASFTAEWKVLNSSIRQEMRLYKDLRRIDFFTEADWQDSRKLLKTAFPLAVRSRRATYDLPFGVIERPTHRNTSWDQAKFEVCGHKWADLSEGDYGAALLNDCKYGYDIHENVMRLSLLRAPVRPDSGSDLGRHEFAYSLFPHKGSWQQGEVVREAYGFNIPLLAAEAQDAPIADNARAISGDLPERFSFAALDGGSPVVEALKLPEDGEGVILRSFDSHGTHSRVPLVLGAEATDLRECDLMEEHCGEALAAGPTTLSYEPFEIKTLKLKF